MAPSLAVCLCGGEDTPAQAHRVWQSRIHHATLLPRHLLSLLTSPDCGRARSGEWEAQSCRRRVDRARGVRTPQARRRKPQTRENLPPQIAQHNNSTKASTPQRVLLARGGQLFAGFRGNLTRGPACRFLRSYFPGECVRLPRKTTQNALARRAGRGREAPTRPCPRAFGGRDTFGGVSRRRARRTPAGTPFSHRTWRSERSELEYAPTPQNPRSLPCQTKLQPTRTRDRLANS